MTTVLITGVRGKTGVELARLLAARPEVAVRGGSGDPASVDLPGVTPTRFSWDDETSWVGAVDDVDAVFLVRPDREDAPELVGRLLAATADGARVVLLSERDVEWFGDQEWAPRVEQVVRDAAQPWTILRPGWFMQVLVDERFLLADLTERDQLPFPGGGAGMAWIDARDIAAVAERALFEDGHGGRVYELTGPESLTLPQTAGVLADVLGRPVAHVETSIAEALEGMEGFERWESEVTFRRVQDGTYGPVTDDVEQVTGRSARSLRRFVTDHAEMLGVRRP